LRLRIPDRKKKSLTAIFKSFSPDKRKQIIEDLIRISSGEDELEGAEPVVMQTVTTTTTTTLHSTEIQTEYSAQPIEPEVFAAGLKELTDTLIGKVKEDNENKHDSEIESKNQETDMYYTF
jgi:hypothetical protein